MIRNQWSDKVAKEKRDAVPQTPANQALALRVHTSRLMGTGPDFVQYSGGKILVKVRHETLFGEMDDVFHVRGLGWDLEVIKAAGLRLEPPKRLRTLDAARDEEYGQYPAEQPSRQYDARRR